MVAVKPQHASAFLASPDRQISAILLFRTDAGLVSERAQGLARVLAARDDPPGEIIRLDEADLERDPDRLAVELLTAPMFGGRKIVRASTGRRLTAQTMKPLLDDAPFPGWLIVEAGSLRPDDALRLLFERSAAAAAIGCYPDEARDLERLVSEVLEAAGLDITMEARAQLVARLGADRALSRNEIEKLALYAMGAKTIELEDVDAIVGDAAEQAIDRVVNAAALGDARRAVRECDRAVSAGESPQTIITAVQRHFLRLHRTRTALDAGRDFRELVRQMRPPLHFKQVQAFETQCRLWPSARLAAALSLISGAAAAARLSPTLETPLAERLLLELAGLGAEKIGIDRVR
jgi:DNA polymerase-3 subunit delta